MKSRTKIIKLIHSDLLHFYSYYHTILINGINADVEFVDGTPKERMFASEKYSNDIFKIEQLLNILITYLNSNFSEPIFSKADLEEVLFDLRNTNQKLEFEKILNYYFDTNRGLVYVEHKKRMRNKNVQDIEPTHFQTIYKVHQMIQNFHK